MSLESLFEKINELTPAEKAELARQRAQAERDAVLLRGAKGQPPTTTAGVLARIPGDIATQMGAGMYRGVSRLGSIGQFVGAQFSDQIRENMYANLRDIEAVSRASSAAAENSALPPIVSEGVAGATESLTLMAPGVLAAPAALTLGAPAATAGTIGLGTMMTTFAGSAAAEASKEAKEHGFTPNEARLYVAANAIIEPAMMAAFQSIGAGGLENMVLRRGAAAATTKAASSFVRSLRKYPNVARFLKASAEELPEEVLTEIVQSGLRAAAGVDPAALDPDRLGESLAEVAVSTLMSTGAVTAVQAPAEKAARAIRLREAKEQRSLMQALRRSEKERAELLARAAEVGVSPDEATPDVVEQAETDIVDALAWGYSSAALNEDPEANPVDQAEEDEIARAIIGTTLRLESPDDASIAKALRALRQAEPAYSDMDAQQILEAEALRWGPEAVLARDQDEMQRTAEEIADALARDVEVAAAAAEEAKTKAEKEAAERELVKSVAKLLNLPQNTARPDVEAALGKLGLSLDAPLEKLKKAIPSIKANRAVAERRRAAQAATEAQQRAAQELRERRAAEFKTIAGRKRQLMTLDNLKETARGNRAVVRALAGAKTPEDFAQAVAEYSKAIGIEDPVELSAEEQAALAKMARRALREVSSLPRQLEGATDADLDELIARNKEAVDAFIERPSRTNMVRMYSNFLGRMPRLGEVERQQLARRLRSRKLPVVTRQIEVLRKRAARLRQVYRNLGAMRKELMKEPPRIDDESFGGAQLRKLQEKRTAESMPQRWRRSTDIVGTREDIARQHRAIMRLVAELRKEVEGAPPIPEEAQEAWARLERETEKVTITPSSYTRALKRLGMRVAQGIEPDLYASAGRMFEAAQYGEATPAEWRDFLKRHGIKEGIKKKVRVKAPESPTGAQSTPRDLEDMTAAELAEMATQLGLKSVKGLSKKALVGRIIEAQKTGAATPKSGGMEEAVYGANTMVYVTVEGENKFPAQYALVPIDAMIPSHRPDTFAPHPLYPYANTRNYESNATYQFNVRQHASNIMPMALLDRTYSPNIGPPIVLPNGVVLGGNSRAMTLQLAKDVFPRQFEKYESDLKEAAPDFGLEPNEVERGYVLVRVLKEMPPEEKIARLIAIFNNSEVNAQPINERGYSVAGLLTPQVIEDMGLEEDEQVSDVIRRAGVRLILNGINSGAIPPSARSELLVESTATKTTLLSDLAKDLIETAIVALVLKDMTVYQSMNANQRELFVRLAVPSLAIEQKITNGELPERASLIPDLQSVAVALVDRGKPSDLRGQTSFITGLSEKAEALFEFLVEGLGRPAKFSQYYRAMAFEIAEMAHSFDPANDMFGTELGAPPEYSESQAIAIINKYREQLAAEPRKGRSAGPVEVPRPITSESSPATEAPASTEGGSPTTEQTASEGDRPTIQQAQPEAESRTTEQTSPETPAKSETTTDIGDRIRQRIRTRAGQSEPGEKGISKSSIKKLGDLFFEEIVGSPDEYANETVVPEEPSFDNALYKKAKPIIQTIWNEAGRPNELNAFVDAIYDKFVEEYGEQEAAAKIERLVPYLQRFAEENNIGQPPPEPSGPGTPTLRDIISKYTRGGINLEGLIGPDAKEMRREIMSAILGRPATLEESKYTQVINAIYKAAGIPENMWNDMAFGGEVRDAVEFWVATGKQYDPNRKKKRLDRVGDPNERIILARPEHTPEHSLDIVPEDLLPHLDKNQRIGVSAVLTGLDRHGGFLLADGAGTGKTRIILAAAREYAKANAKHPVIIIAPNEVLGKPHKNKPAAITGTYANDAKTMGIKINLITDKTSLHDLRKGGIWVTTYHRTEQLLNLVEGANRQIALLILDESHQVKNDDANKSEHFTQIRNNYALRTLYASATPIDKIQHIHYLSNLMDMLPEGAHRWYETLGFVRTMGRDRTVRYVLAKGVTSWEASRRAEKMFDHFTRMGMMIKREISLSGYDIKNISMKSPDEYIVAKDIIADTLNPDGGLLAARGKLKRLILTTIRRHMEMFKVARALEALEASLKEGHQVVFFVNWINRSVVRKRTADKKINWPIVYESEGTAKIVEDYLIKRKIPFGSLHGNSKYAGGSQAVMDDFQAQKIKVVVATPQSGGTGISLDDRVGDAPRTLIALTAPYSAVELVQMLGRVWRLPTKSFPRAFLFFFDDDEVDAWIKDIAINKMRMLGASVSGATRQMSPEEVDSVNEDNLLRYLAPDDPNDDAQNDDTDDDGDADAYDAREEFRDVTDEISFPATGMPLMPDAVDTEYFAPPLPLTGREGEPVYKVEESDAALEPDFEPEPINYERSSKTNERSPKTDPGFFELSTTDPYEATPIEAARLFDVTMFAQMLQKGKMPAVVRHMIRRLRGAGFGSREAVFYTRKRKTGMKAGTPGDQAGPKMKGIFASSGVFIGRLVGIKEFKIDTRSPAKQQLNKFAEQLIKLTVERVGIPEDEIVVRYHHQQGRTYLFEVRKRDKDYASYVLAHESWHLVDYLEEGRMERGNIFGHIAAMKNYLKHTLSVDPKGSYLTLEERKELWREAHEKAKSLKISGKGITVSRLTRILYKEKLEKLRKFRRLLDLEETNKQLLEISIAMRGPIRHGHKQYRMAPVELYADLGAAIMIRPQWVKDNYPDVYEATINWLDARPSAKAAYMAVREMIENGPRPNNMRKWLVDGFNLGEEQRRKEAEAEERAAKRVGAGDWLLTALYDRFHIVQKKIAKYLAEGGKIYGDNPQYAIERAVYSGAIVEAYMKEVHHHVVDLLEKHEISQDDLGVYLFAKRVMKERADLANPGGMRPEDAAKLLEEIKERIGESRYSVLEQAAANFRTIRRNTVIAEMRKGRHWSEDLIKYAEQNDVYVRFNPTLARYEVEHFEDILDQKLGQGTGLKVFHQVGTLREILNPLTATVEQDIRFLRAALWNTAKRETANIFREMKNEFFEEAEERYNPQTGRMEIVERNDSQHATLTYFENGRLRGVYVRPEIAKPFDRADVYKGAHHWWMHSWLRIWLLGLPRELYTGKNPGFWASNMLRDYTGTVARIKGMRILNFFPYYWRAIRPSFAAAFGKQVDVVDRMLREGSLISVIENKGLDAETARIEQLLAQYRLGSASEEANTLVQQIRRVGFWLERVSRAIEMIPKVGADMWLREKFPNMPAEERAHLVRVRAGSPPFLRKGTATWATNDLFLYSNAIVQGWAADIEALREDHKEYLLKRIAYSVMPSMISALLASNFLVMLAKALGADDDDKLVETLKGIRRMYGNISEYNLANYIILPPPFMGVDETGRTIFVRIPQDEFGRLFSGMAHIIMKNALEDPNLEKGIIEMSSKLWSNTPNLNPVIKGVWDALSWFALGNNPYDSFRERNVLSETDAIARTTESHIKVLKHISNTIGLGLIYRFKIDDSATPATVFDRISGTPFIGGNLINRFVQVSGTGTEQELYELRAPLIREQARITQTIERAARKAAQGKKLTQEEEILLSTERGEARMVRMGERTSGDPYRKVLSVEMPRAQRDAISAGIVERESSDFDVSPLVAKDIKHYATILAKSRPLKADERAEWEAERQKAIEWFRKRRIGADKAIKLLHTEPATTQEQLKRRYWERVRIQKALESDKK